MEEVPDPKCGVQNQWLISLLQPQMNPTQDLGPVYRCTEIERPC